MRRPLSFLALPSLFALTFVVSIPGALAQPWAARLVKVLDESGRADLLADGSGKIPVSVTLPPGVSAESLGMAPFGDGTASRRLTPAEAIALGASHPDLDMFVGPPLRPLLDVSKNWTHATTVRKDTGLDGTGTIVGVVDTGIDILHPDFRNKDGSTRIQWLMQMDASGGAFPELEKVYCEDQGTKCAIFSAVEINQFIANSDRGGTLDTSGHGTHVASIAAGNGGPMVNTIPRYIGVAPGADLIVGAMSAVADVDVAYAAKFVFDRADMMKKPCVLNLSIGSDYGAHDGSSIIERRLSRLVGDDKPGHAMVIAAGNSGSLYQVEGEDAPWGIHTEARVYPNADVRVPIYSPASSSGRGYLWVTFEPGDEVSVGLEGPGGSTWLASVSPGHERGYKDGKNIAGVVNNVFKPGAALVPVTNGAVLFWSGKWAANSEFAVHLSGNGHAQMWVVSTGDLTDGGDLLLFKRGMRQGTINVPASAPGLLSVGCTLNRLGWPTVYGAKNPVELQNFGGDTEPELDSVCYFSSAGPTPAGLPKPELSAPGGFVVGAMAQTADPRVVAGSLFDALGCPAELPHCYVADEYHGIAGGTSMSSPHVAGAIALLFQSNPNLTQAQVTSVLQAGARYPGGKVRNEVQLGPGELDLVGAMRALGPEEAEFATPDVAKSWYVLASGYARPDPTWPVVGTVELRRADGEVAHAVDGTFLTLEVKNGVVVSPLTKIRHGLYRFAVAGDVGMGGQSMTVDVLYEGKSMGAKTLAIENDAWTGHEAMDAVGGCSVGEPGSRELPVWAAGAAGVAVAAVALGRRRRRGVSAGRGKR